jgi:biopolymer transport protein ExbD
MSFGQRSGQGKRLGSGGGGGHGGEGEDLMITPLLDLFVALIPFLIMSTVLIKINIADVGISRPVASAANNPSKFDLMVKISNTTAEIVLNGKTFKSVNNVAVDKTEWLAEIHKGLVEIKKQNPDEYRMRLEPTSKVTLQILMSVMDAARKLDAADGEIMKKDEKGQNVKLHFLFPNVVLRGVYS